MLRCMRDDDDDDEMKWNEILTMMFKTWRVKYKFDLFCYIYMILWTNKYFRIAKARVYLISITFL